jgi:ribosomal protein S18 acetylase RimI-like enzyme
VNESGEGEVDALYVAPEHQGRGVGRRLLSASFERFRAAGAENARVVVLAANAPARQFYELMGGSEAGSVELDEDHELLPATAYLWPLHP